MDEQTRSLIWPIFLAEARELLQTISADVLALEHGPVEMGVLDAVRRTAHSLKGSAASLAFGQIEQLAHAIEDNLADCNNQSGLGPGPVEAILRTLESIETVLDEIEAGSVTSSDEPGTPPANDQGASESPLAGELRIDAELDALEKHLSRLCSPEPEKRDEEIADALGLLDLLAGRGPAWLSEVAWRLAVAFTRVSVGGDSAIQALAEIAGYLADLRLRPAHLRATSGANSGGADGLPLDRPRPPRAATEKAIRIGSETVEALARHLETILLGEKRHERRARELLAQRGALQEALRLCEKFGSELKSAGTGAALGSLNEGIQRLHLIGHELARIGRDSLHESDQQRLVSVSLRENLRDVRMVPASLVLEPLRRTVRDLAGRMGKQVDLELFGGDVRLDRRVLDELKAPLVQLVRNAVDHGIELPDIRRAAGKNPTGSLEVKIEPRGSRVAIIVADDGAGLSLERIRNSAVKSGLVTPANASALGDADTARLIFRSGVSTSAEVSAISGRGVGLDLVHEIAMRLQGSVDVTFVAGQETRFVVDLPLMLAATLGVLFRSGGMLGAFPAGAVERSLRLFPSDFSSTAGRTTVRAGNLDVPFVALAQMLGLSSVPIAGRRRAQPALVLFLGAQRAALGVEEVLGHQELVVGSLGPRVSKVALLSGASVLEDGRLIGVLNPAEILRRVRSTADQRPLRSSARILVVDDSLTTRTAMKAILELAGFAVLPASDGEEALSILHRTPCQLVVTDVQMPRVDGLTLTRRIKEDAALRSIPVILITSLEAPEHRAAGLQAGADGYLVKREVERGRLLDMVRQLLPAAA